jgi:hypothetical protein
MIFFKKNRREKKTLDEEFLRREPVSLLSAKFFCSRRRISSLSVVFFVEIYFFYSRRRALRREPKVWLSPKSFTLGEGFVSRSASHQDLVAPPDPRGQDRFSVDTNSGGIFRTYSWVA